MTIKEQVINESIERINKRLKVLQDLFEANPVSRICEIRIEAQKLLEKNTTIEQRTSKEFTAKIEQLAKEEKKQFRLANKLKNSSKLIDEQIRLDSELSSLNSELYYMNMKKDRGANSL